MSLQEYTRRTFLSLMALGTLALNAGCPRPRKVVRVFKRSGRGRHVSNAAKKHNANHLYRTLEAALGDPAHPGDKSKVVMVEINRTMFNKLFPGNKQIADLRHDL